MHKILCDICDAEIKQGEVTFAAMSFVETRQVSGQQDIVSNDFCGKCSRKIQDHLKKMKEEALKASSL